MNESREIKKAAIIPENASFDYGFENGSDYGGGRYETEYIYDRTDVRIIFITLYTLVFCSCLFGNLMVILVVTLSRRLRSTTNFFLANLAVADLCVGIFCVFQNLTIYLIPSWIFGEFLCKMYQFVHSLSYTASIFILVVICTERYLAIIHPIRCKQILTPTRLRLAIGLVWITSTIYSSPRFFYVKTIENHLNEGGSETICILPRTKYNSQLFDMINFVLLYLIPLCVMTVLYTLIAVRLWNSSLGYPPLQRCKKGKSGSSSGGKGTDEPVRIKFEKRRSNTTKDEGRVSIDGDGNRIRSGGGGVASAVSYRVSSSRNVLRARRGVIRMLIIVVLTFGLCNLPIHARKIWQYWSEEYQGASTFSSLFTPLTFLVTYCNSAINPLLYAFLSRNFQKGMKELSLWDCCTRKSGARGPSLNRHDSSFRRRSYRGCSISDHDR